MKRLGFTAALLASTLLVTPALATPAIGINLVGSPALPNGYENGTVAGNVLLTTQDAAASSLIVVATAASSGSTTISSVKDSVANCASAYSVGVSAQLTAQRAAIEYCNVTATDLAAPVTATGSITTTVVTFTANPGTLTVGQAITGSGVTAATQITGGISQWNGTSASATVNNSQSVVSETLTISNTITSTFSVTGTKKALTAFLLTGVATSSPLGTSGSANVASAQTFSVSITPSTSNEMLIACVWLTNGSTSDSYVEDATHGWTKVPGNPFGSSTNLLGHCAYQLAPNTTAITWAPTWSTNNRAGSLVYMGFKAPSASVNPPTLTLLGVGDE